MLSEEVKAEYGVLAQNIYRFRVLQQLSQAKLAEYAGVSSAYISQIECSHLPKRAEKPLALAMGMKGAKKNLHKIKLFCKIQLICISSGWGNNLCRRPSKT